MEEGFESDIRARKRRKWGIIGAFAVFAVGVPAAWVGPRAYSRWQQDRLIGQAREKMAGADLVSATSRLRRVLRYNPDNLAASRLMAEVADRAESPQAVGLHRRVCELQPDSLEDTRALASTALHFGDLGQAAKTLAALRPRASGDAWFHEMAGRLAAAFGRQQEAATEFAEALRLDPGNGTYQLESAENAIYSKADAERETARKKLRELSSNSTFRVPALRALSGDVLREHRVNVGLPIFEQLARDPDASFDDRISYLAVLQAMRHPLFSPYLAELENAARNNADEAAALISWMNVHHFAMVASAWESTLPPEIISKPPVAEEAATSYMLSFDWKKLRAFSSTGDWDNSEFLRHAFLARALRETGDRRGSEEHWNRAVTLASNKPARLSSLQGIAAAWGWQAETNELLWRVADTSEHPDWALKLLLKRYGENQDTHQLLRVWTKFTELHPSDNEARNNYALLSLLLGADREKAAKIAAELAAKNPNDPDIVATQALALHFQRRTGEGLRVLRALKPEQLATPSAAAVYGVLLAAKGSSDAGKYLDLAAANATLPREEQLLVLEARNTKGASVSSPILQSAGLSK